LLSLGAISIGLLKCPFWNYFGFLLALILEGFLLIGGKTILTSVLGLENPPAPISIALDAGKNN